MKVQKDKQVDASSGILMLILGIVLCAVAIGLIVFASSLSDPAIPVIAASALVVVAIFIFKGLTVVPPNTGRVLQIFGGEYRGTISKAGFFFVNPFYTTTKISMRATTLNGEKLKVNDKTGNPIEIAAIIVWQVVDCYKARFEVDDYAQYVRLQSETAIRHITGTFAYDADDGETSLMHNSDEVLNKLRSEVQARVELAGIEIIEARLAHLAYAPEIAAVMLRKQQASAIIAARQRIVDGAVGMVEMALKEFNEGQLIQLDEDRKATMVSNLMVVLCSESNVTPVVNTGGTS